MSVDSVSPQSLQDLTNSNLQQWEELAKKQDWDQVLLMIRDERQTRQP